VVNPGRTKNAEPPRSRGYLLWDMARSIGEGGKKHRREVGGSQVSPPRAL